MNIMQKLTIRSLRENKRRTLVTIIGVIISVSMLTAVATLGVSFIDLFKRQSMATDGEWHVQYKGVNSEQIEKISEDTNTDKVILSNDLGYAKWNDATNEYKPYLFFKQYNENGFKQFPVTLKEGSFPKKENELLISEEVVSNSKVEYKIGDQITVDIGERTLAIGDSEEILGQDKYLQTNELGESLEQINHTTNKTFTIVGIMERPNWEPFQSPGYTVINYFDESTVSESSKVTASVLLKKVNSKLYKDSEKLADELKIEKITYNSELLRYYGVSSSEGYTRMIYSLVAIIMVVIIIGSVALIYNAFAISVSERARHLGMLSSVGATKKQKRNSVFFEGTIIGVISIPLGILAGISGIAITFALINKHLMDILNTTEALKVVVTPYSIIISCVISILTIFISTYLPAIKASKISAVDAIRQTQDIKMKGKKLKTNRFVFKLFGLEAEIGLKNLKRNRRRYQTTVFSLVVSIVLFLTVAFFTENMKKSVDVSQKDQNFDISIQAGSNVSDEELLSMANVSTITSSSLVKEVYLSTYLTSDQVGKSNRSYFNNDKYSSSIIDGKLGYSVNMVTLTDKNFKQYAEKIGVNAEEYLQPNNLKGIVIEKASYFDPNSEKFVEEKVVELKEGDSIDLYQYDDSDGEEKIFNSIEIGSFANEKPLGVSGDQQWLLTMIVTNTVAEQILNNTEIITTPTLYMNSDAPLKAQEELDELKTGNMYIHNLQQQREQAEQMILFISVFTYGFISLISLISIANIFNTISTSISLRKREFAMLRSVGMTPKSFNKMIQFESMFYGIKALLYGLPLSLLVMVSIYWSLSNTFTYGFELPWGSMLLVVVAIFLIVGSAMLYSTSKIRKENIIDGLKQENI
ncbi:ABC transporter permease [Bacillus sp. B1-b2]|uniref:ABC transporter permease n=1 Tax=Bacillus sp. B1-b2 TaxID=2653201 RepID=UPI0012628CF0|nr:FtsX-like permease family protein [Bacillus sp. B1-b2]KAB7666300.1 ABC transporter permease [Bacillus sp. B1-b2]